MERGNTHCWRHHCFPSNTSVSDRTPRFTPFYFNSGFYFVRQTEKSGYLMERMLKTIAEIAETHSHQSTLTKYFSEVIDFTDIHFYLLENKDYPSGYQFHHEKDYIQQLLDFKVLPKVFHMCWTESRNDKVRRCYWWVSPIVSYLDGRWSIWSSWDCGSSLSKTIRPVINTSLSKLSLTQCLLRVCLSPPVVLFSNVVMLETIGRDEGKMGNESLQTTTGWSDS